MMDAESTFKEISEYIKNEKNDEASELTRDLAASTDDISIMLKCASLLKVIEDEEGCQDIIDDVLDKVEDDDPRNFDIGLSIRALGRAEDAFGLMKCYRTDDDRIPEVARTLMLIDESEEALSMMTKRGCKSIDDRILLCDILCSLGEFAKAQHEAEDIVKENGASYKPLLNLVTVLMKKGDVKNSIKVAKEHLKEDKKNAESLALQAYVMYISGKIPAAANYANRALQIDYSNIGALEVMAMCFIEKGKYKEAKLLAGVINEKDPLDPSVMRILDACRITSSS